MSRNLSQGDSLANTPIPEDSATPPVADSKSAPAPLPVIIVRDYGYAVSDERHHGVVVIQPDSESRRSSKWFGEDKKSWSGFNLLGWRFGRKRSEPSGMDGLSGSTSASESRNTESPVEADGVEGEDDCVFDSDSSANGEGQMVDDEEPAGMYIAAYAFESMGDNELGVEEGELVYVSGRGGGEGWVVGVRKRVVGGKIVPVEGEDEEGAEGLVPEAYLERTSMAQLARMRGAS